jgi:hypothetical protein
MNKGLLSSLAVLFCVVLAGCGDGSVQSGGTVTFTTGAPVPSGLVFFEDPQFSYRGTIENGSYKIEGVTKGSGLPPGTYKVYVMGTDPNISYATAVGVINSVVSLILVWGANAFSRRFLEESLW